MSTHYEDTYYEEDILSDLFDDDTIEEEVIQMKNGKQELLTVISLKDNPSLNLSVAQPSKYKVSKHTMGTGIVAYKLNALDILKRDLKTNEKIIKIQINTDKVLDLCTYRHKQYIKEVYKTANRQFSSDNEFMEYVYRKGKKKFNLVIGIVHIGNLIFEKSTIREYQDIGCLIKDADIITEATEL